MAFRFSTSTREVLEQIVREPSFHKFTNIPIFAVQNIGIIIFSYIAIISTTYLYLQGHIHILLAIAINAYAMFAIFTPLHDAVHRTVSGNRKFNDILGTIACFPLLTGITTRIYRYLHLEHHRFTGDKLKDPDEPFVTSNVIFMPFVLAGLDVLWSVWYLKHWSTRPFSERIEFAIGITIYVSWSVAWLLSPYAWEFIYCWLIPQRIAFFTITYFFARIQHPEGVLWEEAPFQCTTKINSNKFQRMLMLGQSDHFIHHLLPSIPYYRYHDAWLAGKELFDAQNIPSRDFFTKSKNIVLPSQLKEQVWFDCHVVNVRSIAAGVREYKLDISQDNDFPVFSAGSHIDVKIREDLIRQYSICSSPDEQNNLLISVKKEEEGRGGSQALHDEVEAGQMLQISSPRNNFPLSKGGHEYILIAGGIGVTPLLSMAYELFERDVKFTLHICSRDQQCMPYFEQLKEFPFVNNIKIHLDDRDESQILDPIKAIGTWEKGKELYFCGPNGFMGWIDASAKKSGWPITSVFSETFVPRKIDETENKIFKVKLARSGKILTVAPDEFLLDVLNANDCGVICSCTQGICGSCITPVIEGVPEHRDAVLTDEQRNNNKQMCVCVSRAKSDLLILDL